MPLVLEFALGFPHGFCVWGSHLRHPQTLVGLFFSGSKTSMAPDCRSALRRGFCCRILHLTLFLPCLCGHLCGHCAIDHTSSLQKLGVKLCIPSDCCVEAAKWFGDVEADEKRVNMFMIRCAIKLTMIPPQRTHIFNHIHI